MVGAAVGLRGVAGLRAGRMGCGGAVGGLLCWRIVGVYVNGQR